MYPNCNMTGPGPKHLQQTQIWCAKLMPQTDSHSWFICESTQYLLERHRWKIHSEFGGRQPHTYSMQHEGNGHVPIISEGKSKNFIWNDNRALSLWYSNYGTKFAPTFGYLESQYLWWERLCLVKWEASYRQSRLWMFIQTRNSNHVQRPLQK